MGWCSVLLYVVVGGGCMLLLFVFVVVRGDSSCVCFVVVC